MSAGRAWFYLTLFNGTPPGETEYVTAKIEAASAAKVRIAEDAIAEAKIWTKNSTKSEIKETDESMAKIQHTTEVTWRVGRA